MTATRPSRDTDQAATRRTLAIIRPATGRVVLATLLGAGAIAADIGLIGTAAWLISRASQHPNEAALALAIVAVQFFGLMRGILRYEERLVGHDAAFRLLADLRVTVYRRLEQLAPSGLPSFRRGDLLARIVQDVDSLQDLVLRVVPPFGIALVVGVSTVVLLWWMLPAAGLILLVSLVLAATVVPWLTGLLARRREARFAAVRGDLGAAMVDLTEGAAELIAFGVVESHVRAIRSQDAELSAIASAAAGTAGVGLALTTLLAGLACWGCLMVGIPAVLSGRLAATELAVITLVPLAAFELVVGLPVATQALQRARHAAARVFDVLDAPAPVTEPEPGLPLPRPPHDVDVRAMWARYPGAPDAALRDMDVSLPAGRRVAVVGPSGAGKSTLAAVLVRFLAYDAGSVTLSGDPIESLSGDDLRTVIGLVGQDAYLFDTTVAENLRVGMRAATDDQLHDVLGRVGLGHWISGLPLGLATEVGSHGSNVSGGQRQRLAVARALLTDFPVLVLDEPAEHLEPAAADALSADIWDVTHGRSVVCITHRLAGLESVDEILVMESGRVVERGTHDELLGLAGRYSALWWEEMRTERHARSPEEPVTVFHDIALNDGSLTR